MRPGGGVDLVDHALPDVPNRVDPSRADRHPIDPDRERADSRSRRARGLPDRSHSPPGRARDGPHTRARGDISISPNRDVGRNRSPRPAAVPDRGPEARSRQSRGERPIRDSVQSPGDRWGTPGAPSDRGQASAPAARGAPGTGGPDAPKICALDNPNDRNPDAEFSCVTCNREFFAGFAGVTTGTVAIVSS